MNLMTGSQSGSDLVRQAAPGTQQQPLERHGFPTRARANHDAAHHAALPPGHVVVRLFRVKLPRVLGERYLEFIHLR